MRLKASSKYKVRANERWQDQVVEERKEMEHTKMEEAVQLARKEHDYVDAPK